VYGVFIIEVREPTAPCSAAWGSIPLCRRIMVTNGRDDPSGFVRRVDCSSPCWDRFSKIDSVVHLARGEVSDLGVEPDRASGCKD
jgi:hypothetical protein